jgi:hypothetical protein
VLLTGDIDGNDESKFNQHQTSAGAPGKGHDDSGLEKELAERGIRTPGAGFSQYNGLAHVLGGSNLSRRSFADRSKYPCGPSGHPRMRWSESNPGPAFPQKGSSPTVYAILSYQFVTLNQLLKEVEHLRKY